MTTTPNELRAAAEPNLITIRFDDTGKMSRETINEMFRNARLATASLEESDINGFLVGIRVICKLAEAAGVPLREMMNGRIVKGHQTEEQHANWKVHSDGQ